MTLKLSRAKTEYQNEDTPAEVPVRTKSGEPVTGKDDAPAVLLVIGQHSKEYRRRDHAIQKRNMSIGRRVDPDRVEAIGIERLAAGIVGWRNLVDDDGAEIQYSPENAAALLRELPHLQEDVREALTEHQRFFSNASAS